MGDLYFSGERKSERYRRKMCYLEKIYFHYLSQAKAKVTVMQNSKCIFVLYFSAVFLYFIFLLGDFNRDLLNYDQHSPTNKFIDSLSSHMLLAHVVQPPRIRSNSKTLIDNIYSNVITAKNKLGNLTATIFDHLSQLLIALFVFVFVFFLFDFINYKQTE